MSDISSQKILHIVNDALTAQTLANSEIPGEIIPWQDALYEGPAVNLADIDKFTIYRAKYFAACRFGEYKDIHNAYLERNARLKEFHKFSRIVLWFDHDLYGQLQLVQLIDWFNRQDTGRTEICAVDLRMIKSRNGKKLRISQLSPVDLNVLFNKSPEVTLQQAKICELAWKAFTSNSPHNLLHFHPRDLSTMPYLRDAMVRLAKEFPSKETGLSRTEFLIIDAVKNKKYTEDEIFSYVQGKEPVAFMSKTIFLHRLQHLMNAKYPVLKKEVINAEVVLELSGNDASASDTMLVREYFIKVTNHTNQVLNKWVDWVQLNGINRWIGGVHLNDGNMWRYDSIAREINKTYV